MIYSVPVLLVALAAFGAANPGGYVVVAVLFDHPFLFGVAALGTLGTAFWVGPGPRAVRATGLALATVGAFGWAWVGGMSLMMFSISGRDQIVRESAPSGGLEVRVIEGAQLIDTVWELRVRRPAGLWTRDWSAGCLNGDNADNAFVSVKWNGPETLVIKVLDGRVLRVDLDPATGRPLRPVDTGAGC